MSRIVRTAVVTLAAGIAFLTVTVINADYIRQWFFPKQFTFGKPEMLKTLDVVNQTRSWSFQCDEHTCVVDIALRPVPGKDSERRVTALDNMFGSRAFACESRSFFQSASACYDTTTLSVAGAITLRQQGEVPAQHDATGLLTATGTSLGRISLELRIDHGFIALHARDARHFEITSIHMRTNAPEARELRFFRSN